MKDWLKNYSELLLENKSNCFEYSQDLTLHIRFVKEDDSLTEPIFVGKACDSGVNMKQNNK